MKEKDIKVDYKEQQMVVYAEKEDQSFGAVVTGSYASKNYLDDFFLKKKNLEKELREELEQRKISPVYYYMILQDMGPGDLAKRIGISKRKLRKHFAPKGYATLDDVTIQKYALVFGVKVEELRKLGQGD